MPNARLVWNPQFIERANRAMSPGGGLQKLVDSLIYESIKPYVPFDQGMLFASAAATAACGRGKIVWSTPYARYLYYGLIYVDPKTGAAGFKNKDGEWKSRRGVRKVNSGRPLVYQRKQPKAGSFWCERWKRDNLTALEKNLQRMAGELI